MRIADSRIFFSALLYICTVFAFNAMSMNALAQTFYQPASVVSNVHLNGRPTMTTLGYNLYVAFTTNHSSTLSLCSTQDGTNFTTPVEFAQFNIMGNPVFVPDNGLLTLIYADNNDKTLKMSSSYDSGATFQTPQQILVSGSLLQARRLLRQLQD